MGFESRALPSFIQLLCTRSYRLKSNQMFVKYLEQHPNSLYPGYYYYICPSTPFAFKAQVISLLVGSKCKWFTRTITHRTRHEYKVVVFAWNTPQLPGIDLTVRHQQDRATRIRKLKLHPGWAHTMMDICQTLKHVSSTNSTPRHPVWCKMQDARNEFDEQHYH